MKSNASDLCKVQIPHSDEIRWSDNCFPYRKHTFTIECVYIHRTTVIDFEQLNNLSKLFCTDSRGGNYMINQLLTTWKMELYD